MSKNTMHDSTATASRPGTGNTPAPAALRKSLKNRHVQLIALGGAIGTGLFYGSSESIALAGPSILLAYLVGGLAIFMFYGRGSRDWRYCWVLAWFRRVRAVVRRVVGDVRR